MPTTKVGFCFSGCLKVVVAFYSGEDKENFWKQAAKKAHLLNVRNLKLVFVNKVHRPRHVFSFQFWIEKHPVRRARNGARGVTSNKLSCFCCQLSRFFFFFSHAGRAAAVADACLSLWPPAQINACLPFFFTWREDWQST